MKKLHVKQHVPSTLSSKRLIKFITDNERLRFADNVQVRISSFTIICVQCSCTADICTCGGKDRRYNVAYSVKQQGKLLGHVSGTQEPDGSLLLNSATCKPTYYTLLRQVGSKWKRTKRTKAVAVEAYQCAGLGATLRDLLGIV